MSVLAIYTNSFPYGNAETFLESEIEFLAIHFNHIYIIPTHRNGLSRILPNNVRVLSPLQEKKWPLLKIYFAGFLNYHKIKRLPELKNELANFSFIKSLKYFGYAILTKQKITGFLLPDITLHYSYWLNFSAFSLSLLKLEGKIKTVISRAHGYDLYEERGEKSLNFIKAATLKNLDKLFLISDHGRNYLLKKFPEFSDKYHVSRLGSRDPEFTNPLTENNQITLASCSAINPNKRLELILDSLTLFKNKYPSINLKWYHLGSGKGISKLLEKAKNTLHDSSVECIFLGQLTSQEVFNFYNSVPVDVFVNVSENEGIPVSIMEAQSCSIPVIATNAGGTSEIVDNENGLLLSSNPLPDELADTFHRVYMQKEIWKNKRNISRKNWENNFSAKKNYTNFSEYLLTLI
jgi:glycosyltransferase involved in cell wall biosynthesis